MDPVDMEPASADLDWKNYANLVAFVMNTAITFGSLLIALPGAENNSFLSAKYQTLVTPSGAAFAIWGPIFIAEGIFIGFQMTQRFRKSPVVQAVTPGWLLACAAQVAWTLAFNYQKIEISLVCMYAILAGLMWVSASTDGLAMSWAEWGALRPGLSLHLGWIICASAVNTNVLADRWMSSQETLLGLAVTTVGVVSVIQTVFALAKKTPDPIVCLVAAWAFHFIAAELRNPMNLDGKYEDPDDVFTDIRFNPNTWSRVTLAGLALAASNIRNIALALAGVASARVMWSEFQGGSNQKNSDHIQELVDSSVQGA